MHAFAKQDKRHKGSRKKHLKLLLGRLDLDIQLTEALLETLAQVAIRRLKKNE